MTSFLSAQAANPSPSIIPDANSSVSSHFVMGDTKHYYQLSGLTDADLQTYISHCAAQFLAAQKRWEESGDFAAIGDRDMWWQAEAEALRERGSRAHLVKAMERELGL
jgi:hypothetical protein